MKNLAILLFSAFVVGINSETYTTRFDSVDVEEIINSDRLMKNYINCLMERGNCAPDAAELKKVLPDALVTDCSKCSEKQKEGAVKIIKHLYKNRPEWWQELQNKYDPDQVYYNKHKNDETFAS